MTARPQVLGNVGKAGEVGVKVPRLSWFYWLQGSLSTKMLEGGRVTTVLKELCESGFITPFISFGKKVKGRRYRLTDQRTDTHRS